MHAQELILSMGLLGVFYASVLEEIIVFIPSSLIQLSAGFFLLGDTPFSLEGLMRLTTHVALPAAIGVLIGSLPIYFIAYYGGELAIRRFGKWFMLKWEQVEMVRHRLHKKKRFFWLLTLLRVLPAMPSVAITAFSGVVRLPFLAYAGSTLLGVFFRALIMGLLGWFSNGVYESLAARISHIESIGGLVVGVLLIGGIGFLLYAKKARSHRGKKV